ncbi:MAG: hypothetical protein Kow0063_12960 [Anaerolineae bacterium]
MSTETITLDQALRASEQLSLSDQLRLISLLSERLRQQVDPTQSALDILESAGLGAEIWQPIDADAYIREERANWER